MNWPEIRGWTGTALNFVPLLWLGYLAYHYERRDVSFLWVATAFGLGGIADLLGHPKMLGWETAGHIYPVSQSAILAAVLLDKETAVWFLYVIGVVALGSYMLWSIHPDVPLHVLAWGGLAWIGWRAEATPFRPVLLASFGAALPAYLWYVWGGRQLPQWFMLQAAYAAGIYYFCVAASRTRTALAVV